MGRAPLFEKVVQRRSFLGSTDNLLSESYATKAVPLVLDTDSHAGKSDRPRRGDHMSSESQVTEDILTAFDTEPRTDEWRPPRSPDMPALDRTTSASPVGILHHKVRDDNQKSETTKDFLDNRARLDDSALAFPVDVKLKQKAEDGDQELELKAFPANEALPVISASPKDAKLKQKAKDNGQEPGENKQVSVNEALLAGLGFPPLQRTSTRFDVTEDVAPCGHQAEALDGATERSGKSLSDAVDIKEALSEPPAPANVARVEVVEIMQGRDSRWNRLFRNVKGKAKRALQKSSEVRNLFADEVRNLFADFDGIHPAAMDG